MDKIYKNNEQGKREFVDEIIRPLVLNEEHFADAMYVSNERGEYILLYRYGETDAAYAINVTADSIAALTRDFMRYFPRYIEEETY